MARGLAALAADLIKVDADLPAVVESLRMALLARNPDFEIGIFNANSAVEGIVRVMLLPIRIAENLTECKTEEAFEIIERHAAEGFRLVKSPLGPGAWGPLLASLNRDRL